ncbi:hypothetical protein AB833_14285 [Chromatiales bacterium (ex Bugula neritina AB1)]|nr:hypothetical protein AB833_14285 [Chromatiales bacterium (ex Bugula neritina AB1)]
MLRQNPFCYSFTEAQKHLRKVDKTMASLMRRVGKTAIRSEAELTIYESLVRAIVYQMLSTKSAAAIHSRLLDACDDDVSPARIVELGEGRLREIGFSRAKVASVMDLSQKIRTGAIPADQELTDASDEDLIRCLTDVKGIGLWTVEMLMVFNLGRADVLPATDLGIRKGHMMAYGLEEMLSARELLKAGEIWRPYRTVASWYLWRATDSVRW